MARFSLEDVEKYGGTGGSGFFSLSDDGDVATVRIMYNSIDDFEGYAVHEVQIDGKKRWVNCLRNYNDPLDNCPFCKSGKYQQVRFFIPLYDVASGTVKYWERGKKFASKISSLASRYPDLVAHEFEVERHGKKGSADTTYEIYEVGHDNTTLEDLPQPLDALGNIILDKTDEEMEHFLEYDEFPNDEFPNEDVHQVPTRESARNANEPIRRRTDSSVGRRTPATRNRDRF